MVARLELTDTPAQTDLEQIGGNLAAFNAGAVGASERREIAVLVRDDSDFLTGGLVGYTAWGWLYVQWLWLAEPLRGRGMAGQLLAMAEAEAVARNCHGALIDTFNPLALKAYQRAGYVVFGTLPDCPKGRTRHFLQKSLA